MHYLIYWISNLFIPCFYARNACARVRERTCHTDMCIHVCTQTHTQNTNARIYIYIYILYDKCANRSLMLSKCRNDERIIIRNFGLQ